jgi:hypothetical protein
MDEVEKARQMQVLHKAISIMCEWTERHPSVLRTLRVQTANTILIIYIQDGEVQHLSSFSWN